MPRRSVRAAVVPVPVPEEDVPVPVPEVDDEDDVPLPDEVPVPPGIVAARAPAARPRRTAATATTAMKSTSGRRYARSGCCSKVQQPLLVVACGVSCRARAKKVALRG
jgi:hypothetical protein